MSALWRIAGKEFGDGLRNRWVAAAILALALLALVLAFLGSAPTGSLKAGALAVTLVSLASLSVYLLPLIALMLAYDAIVGEAERGTLALLLSYPVARWQVLLGKFLGHLAILAVAVLLGYGLAGAAVGLISGAEVAAWLGLAGLCAGAVLLGAVFLGFGYLVSTLVGERAQAAGLALGLWLVLVVLYDLVLLGLLIADAQQALPPPVFTLLLSVNPTDAFRLLTMSFSAPLRDAGGLAGLGAAPLPGSGVLLAILAGWLFAALAAAAAVFHRKEV